MARLAWRNMSREVGGWANILMQRVVPKVGDHPGAGLLLAAKKEGRVPRETWEAITVFSDWARREGRPPFGVVCVVTVHVPPSRDGCKKQVRYEKDG
jgi:hypothetical protein